MDYKEFFLTDNKSGWKTNEKILKSKNNELYNLIINYHSVNNLPVISFKEKIWYFMNDIKTAIICKNCSAPIKFGRSLREGYGTYCSIKCTNTSNEHKEKIIKTNYVNFGGKSPMASDDVKNKHKGTLIKKYGVNNAMLIPNSIEKLKAKTRLKYGVDFPMQSDVVKHKLFFIEKLNDDNIIDVKTNYLKYKCNICGNISEIDNNLYNYRKRNNIPYCTNCYPKYKFNQQIEIINFLKEYKLNIIENDRNSIKPYEIDILINNKFGIEYNGLYWHSELFKDMNYHLLKYNKANESNINLIQIFEDEWINKKEIVKSIILSKLKLNNIVLYARKCNLRELTNTEYKNFIDKNHIQGYSIAKYKYGLFYNNELVSTISFSSCRKIMNKNKKENEYELMRFCNKINTSVVGGFAKLLKYFINIIKPTKIVTYADKRYSNGDLYIQNGFSFISSTKPNYYYIINNKRLYRYNFRKDILVKEGYDSKKSEREIMLDRKIFRIYDCGSHYFELFLKKDLTL